VTLALNVLIYARLAWCGWTTLVVCIQAALTHLLSAGGSLVAREGGVNAPSGVTIELPFDDY
jgi:hypothetical protein